MMTAETPSFESLLRLDFERAVEEHGPLVKSVIWNKIRTRSRFHDVDDVYQDVLVALWKNWDRVIGDPKGYMVKVALNKCVDWTRRGLLRSRPFVRLDSGDDDDGSFMAEDWSKREHVEKSRADDGRDPDWWVNPACCEEDLFLCRLAIALTRMRVTRKSPGYKFHMKQWVPPRFSVQVDKWTRRMDNLKTFNREIGVFKRDQPRIEFLKWTRRSGKRVLAAVYDGKWPPLRKGDEERELRCWMSHLKATSRIATGFKSLNWGECGEDVLDMMPDGFREMLRTNPRKACLWFRRNWADFRESLVSGSH